MLLTVSGSYAQIPDAINDALADLSTRLGVNLTLNDMQQWRWSSELFADASLGCPEPDKLYAQVATNGFIIEFTYNNLTYEYRVSNDRQTVILCNAPISDTALPTNPPLPNPTVTLPPTDAYFPCPDALTGSVPSRMKTGIQGQFIGTTGLNMRMEPNRTAAVAGIIRPGDLFTVLDGPQCDATFTWWRVDTNQVSGWIAEVDSSNFGYWLEPLASVSPATPFVAEIPANRQAITPETAAQIIELARLPVTDPSHILAGNTPLNRQGIVIITTPDSLLLYDNLKPENPLSTLNGHNILNAAFNTDHSGIVGIEVNANNQPGMGFFSTTGGGGSSESMDVNFTNGLVYLPELDLVAFGGESAVLLYDVVTRQVVADLPLKGNPVSMAVDREQSILAVTIAPDSVILWDVSTRSEIGSLANSVSGMAHSNIAFSPDGNSLAVGNGFLGEVVIVDVETLEIQQTTGVYERGSGGEILDIAYSPDGSVMAIIGG
ncbi:MAG TPA: hypothetical protein VJZ27_17415, partial [Aggregatilineales bacterium]|nr:hypothetical protein [Aggregatilineales bacterium]